MRVPHGPGRRLAALAAAVCFTLLIVAPVSAHAELVSSGPEPNASLQDSPETLILRFTEPLDLANASIELLDPAQDPIGGLGEAALAERGRALTVPLPELEPGVYVVTYQVLSTVDGHVTSGSFAFQVDPTGSAPAPNVDPTSEAPTADLATAVARWVALASGLTLFGTAFFWLFSGRPSLGFAKVERGRLRMWRVFRIAALLTVFGLLTYLAFASRGLPAASADGNLSVDPVGAFGWTPFAIAMRVALAGAAVALLWASGWSLVHAARLGGPRDAETEPARERLALLILLSLAGVTLLGFSFAGHVAAIGGPLYAMLDWAHLLGVGVWLGSLPGFLLFWLLYARRAVDKRRRGMLGDAIARHSRFALAAGPVVALTGIANSPLVLGAGRNLVASDYGNLLLAKALLFSVAIGIGAANFFLVRRRAVGTLLWTVSAEVAVAALAVLTAAGLLTVPPAAARQPRLVTTPVATEHLYDAVDELAIHTIVSVPAPGNQTYQVALSEADSGAPAQDLQRVFLVFTPPDDTELSEQRVETEAVPDRPGLFEVRGAYTPVVGEWGIGVVLRRAGVPDERVDFSLPVVTPPPPERLPPEDTGIDVPAPLGALWRLIPPAPYEWLPALSLFGLAGVLWVAAPTRNQAATSRARRLAVLRTSIVAVGVAATLVAGSQALVIAANAGGDPVLPTENPVAPTVESIAAGEAAFRATCAICHGVAGRGDGPAADGLSVRPSDLSVHVPFHTDAELFAFATRGISGTPMPGFARELTAEDRWDLINYLRSEWPAE
ncbi:MAG: copper resistance protein CopC [Candidatus Limnocylindria bacterium]